MAADWRATCRQCGAPPAKGRAWCRRCLDRMARGLPTDVVDIPKHDIQKALPFMGPYKPFPYWP